MGLLDLFSAGAVARSLFKEKLILSLKPVVLKKSFFGFKNQFFFKTKESYFLFCCRVVVAFQLST